MQRKSVVFLVTTLVLLSGLMSGCSKSDKGTNPMPTTEPFDSGNLVPGQVFLHTFNTTGSFGYRCRIHGSMAGTVTVAAGGADSALVQIHDFFFNPTPVTVKTSGSVRWQNMGATTHTVSRP